MSYRLEAEEAAGEAVRRIAREQIDGALASLRQESDRGEAVHDTRKRLKKLRALLRLVRPELGTGVYKRENAAFRDAGRSLSGLRDAEVLVETLDGLRERSGALVTARAFTVPREELKRRRQRAMQALLEDEARDREVAEALDAARRRVDDWPLESGGWKALAGGLERSYGRGRGAFARAFERAEADDFHDWRKRAKDLWYHLRLLREVWPPVMKATLQEAKQLADLLGEEHDLTVLDETLAAEPEAFGDPDDIAALRRLIAERREELRAAVRPVGRRLYAEKPKRFAARLHRYWKAGRSG